MNFGLMLIALSLNILPAIATAATRSYDFCNLPEGVITGRDEDLMWNEASVQFHTKTLVQNRLIQDTPWVAYPLSYTAMTAVRDQERCHGGSLSTSDVSNAMIGDHLADLMSRWLVKSTAACADGSAKPVPAFGICHAMQQMRQGQHDVVRSALEMTAIYLSSHMSTALAAVILDDAFWAANFPSTTHCGGEAPCSPAVKRARIAYVERYKVHYDLNNRFLANNLSIVVDTLSQGCYVRGGALGLGVKLAELIPASDQVFGSIRDLTFKAGVRMARRFDAAQHPMLLMEKGRSRANFGSFGHFTAAASELKELERTALATFAPPLLLAPVKFLGSRTWASLANDPPSLDSGCYQAKPAEL